MGSPSSSAHEARRALGLRLRDIRTRAGLTQIQLAGLMGRHQAKISRAENGRLPSADEIADWCRYCHATDQITDLIATMQAIETMWAEWRQMERQGLRHAQDAVLPLYELTRRFRTYSSWLIPGMVQTREYTEAILRAIARRRTLPDDVGEAVERRMQRQQLLRQGGKTWAFLLEESVLRAGVGGPDVMSAQLGHLLVCASYPNVALGILPAGPGRDAAWPVEDFWIYDEEQVNVELVSGYLTVTRPHEVAMYAQVFTELAEVAVYGAAARARISAALDALE